MPIQKLSPEESGLPKFSGISIKRFLKKDSHEKCSEIPDRWVNLFNLSSHKRAREAIEFGLSVRQNGFNIFVIGEDKSGRMTATLAFLKSHTCHFSKPFDWVYLNNFKSPLHPIPFSFSRGQGNAFKLDMKRVFLEIKSVLSKLFDSAEFMETVQRKTYPLEEDIRQRIEKIRKYAQKWGLDLERAPDGTIVIVTLAQNKTKPIKKLEKDAQKKLQEGTESVRLKLEEVVHRIKKDSAEISFKIDELRRSYADQKITPLFKTLEKKYGEKKYGEKTYGEKTYGKKQNDSSKFGSPHGLKQWIQDLKADILDHLSLFVEGEQGGSTDVLSSFKYTALERYTVNLFVCHGDDAPFPIVVESNPTYENIFGGVKYQTTGTGYETNFNLIEPGSLHRANGGILVIRADAIGQYPFVWESLKAALRDREIRIEEMEKPSGTPMLQAPNPLPIPLDVKIILIGPPRWYAAFFFNDPDFQSYFNVKADIDLDLESTDSNLTTYATFLMESAKNLTNLSCTPGVIENLLGYASRIAGQRNKLTAQVELLEDILAEAGAFATASGKDTLTVEHLTQAFHGRRLRNARMEELYQEDIRNGLVMIETKSEQIGVINALTVLQSGGYVFGMPSRITARTFVGVLGIINIERMVDMGGPIQQKGVLELEGFLKGSFAQNFPLSFGCSITFEQVYGEVEGDSASLAELCAILSSLSEIPLRQDIAITGSLNQMGVAQAIGGVNEKIEGFFKTCCTQGLTGTQGVIIPMSNKNSLALNQNVIDEMVKGRFHIWAVENVSDAMELLTGMPAGQIHDYPGTNSIFRRVYEKLERYNTILSKPMTKKSQK